MENKFANLFSTKAIRNQGGLVGLENPLPKYHESLCYYVPLFFVSQMLLYRSLPSNIKHPQTNFVVKKVAMKPDLSDHRMRVNLMVLNIRGKDE